MGRLPGVVGVYEFNATDDKWYFDVFGADLTEGQTTLQQLVTNGSKTATSTKTSLGNNQLGIGTNEGLNNYSAGLIDEVAYYGAELSSTVLQDHLDAIYIPEPSTLALLGLGIFCLLFYCRPKKQCTA